MYKQNFNAKFRFYDTFVPNIFMYTCINIHIIMKKRFL